MDRLNAFNHYDDKTKNHEDVLTRNFLFILKNIPAVQLAFFELIKAKTKSINLEPAALGKLKMEQVHTQVVSGTSLFSDLQDYNILSIIISDDEFQSEHIVKESNRNARYDGVIICEPSWLFIIENKPSASNIWEGQLDPNCKDAENNKIITEPCKLSWRDIIETLSEIINVTITNDIERTLIEDFLEYVNETYEWLNPYKTLSLCKGVEELINKRCSSILKEAFPNNEIRHHKGWRDYLDISDEDNIVKKVALAIDKNSIVLYMYAGDTMKSAKSLYSKIDTNIIKEKISDRKYIIYPNFHFSFRNCNLIWFDSTEINFIDYIDFWKNELDKNEIKQVSKNNLNEYYNYLVDRKIIDSKDLEVKNVMLSKGYSKFNVCPGLYFGYRWSLDEAIKLDDDCKFTNECKKKIKEIQSMYSL